jgi:hypothetical protein
MLGQGRQVSWRILVLLPLVLQMESVLQIVHPRRLDQPVVLEPPYDNAGMDAELLGKGTHCFF